MSLTGSAFLALVMVLTVLAFVAVLWQWPRLAGGHWTAWFGRLGMLLGVNALVLLVAATSLNDTYQFYADWTDLFGVVTGTHMTTAHGGTTPQAALGPGRPVERRSARSRPPALPPLPPGAGPADRVLRYTVTGASSGIRGQVLVELPPAYFDRRQATRTFPVLEALHGFPGEPAQWTDTMPLSADLTAGAMAGRNSEAIVVAPATAVPATVDTECVNGPPGTPQIETWLAQDVPTWVRHTFRVRTDRTSWATIGLSAGGYCAAMVTMLHPDHFSAAIVLGGYFRPIFGHQYRPFTSASPLGRRYDLVRLARSRPPPVALWVETSHSDHVSFPSSQQVLTLARAPLSVQAVVLSHAGHRMSLWQALLPRSVAWIGASVPGFRPLSTGP